MLKDQMLEHWQNIPDNQKIAIRAVEYKHTGSTYDEDGIRITGSQEFIDSVLSRLKDLLAHENDHTRLQVVYKQSTDRETRKELDSFNCYVQVHERGHESQIMNSIIRGAKERQAAKESPNHIKCHACGWGKNNQPCQRVKDCDELNGTQAPVLAGRT